MNLMKGYRANVAAFRRFGRKPISGNVKVLAIFETPRRGSRAAVDWGPISHSRRPAGRRCRRAC
jgi:hypothetical protein